MCSILNEDKKTLISLVAFDFEIIVPPNRQQTPSQSGKSCEYALLAIPAMYFWIQNVYIMYNLSFHFAFDWTTQNKTFIDYNKWIFSLNFCLIFALLYNLCVCVCER